MTHAHGRNEVDLVEDLTRVPLGVRGRELDARAPADAEPVVLAVLQSRQLGRRCELSVVAVFDAGARERLQPLRVRPGVLASAHAAPPAHVEHQAHVGRVQRSEEPVER